MLDLDQRSDFQESFEMDDSDQGQPMRFSDLNEISPCKIEVRDEYSN